MPVDVARDIVSGDPVHGLRDIPRRNAKPPPQPGQCQICVGVDLCLGHGGFDPVKERPVLIHRGRRGAGLCHLLLLRAEARGGCR